MKLVASEFDANKDFYVKKTLTAIVIAFVVFKHLFI